MITPSKHPVPARLIETVFDRVDVRSADECWLWKLSIGTHGYGQATWSLGGKRSAGTTAHRVVWIATHGPIPDGLTVDHLCRNRPCCNPAHLRLLSNEENARQNGFLLRTRCPRGHPYDEVNTYRSPRGDRRCRTCARDRRATR